MVYTSEKKFNFGTFLKVPAASSMQKTITKYSRLHSGMIKKNYIYINGAALIYTHTIPMILFSISETMMWATELTKYLDTIKSYTKALLYLFDQDMIQKDLPCTDAFKEYFITATYLQ